MAMHKLITFDIGEQCLGIDVMAVREIRTWAPATPLPNTPPYMKGVVNLRGVVLPVFDLRNRIGWGVTEPSERHVIIVVQSGAHLCGLIVDAVNDIVTLDEAVIQPVPETGSRASDFITGLANHGDRMVLMLSLDAIGEDVGIPQAA
jgi:purine-binding chemotaxis protein CheW